MAVIFEGENWVIHKEGITQEGRYIAWSNVKSLYIGGMKGRLNFIYPAGEKWELTIVDFSNNTINIKQSAFFKMRDEKKNEFFETYKFILSQISEQQWSHFQQKLRNNEKINFHKLYLDSDGVYCKQFWGEYFRIPLNSLAGQFTKEGNLYVNFRRPSSGKLRRVKVGSVNSIPNIHILQKFIDMHSTNSKT